MNKTATQIIVKVKDKEAYLSAIELPNGDIICGCCGGITPKQEVESKFEIVERYDEWWSDLTEFIVAAHEEY